MKKAILLGASGFIGAYLLDELLWDPAYSQVVAIARRPLSIAHPKLKVLIGDFQTLPSLKAELVADEIFLALGTTKKNTPDQKVYYKVDHDYPVLAAKIAKEQGAKTVFIVTAVGANADSGVFYIKTKGETERDIIALNFEQTHIFRPSMLLGSRTNEHRSMEKLLINIFSVINPLFIGSFKKYRGIDGKELANAMHAAATSPIDKVKIYEWEEMKQLNKL